MTPYDGKRMEEETDQLFEDDEDLTEEQKAQLLEGVKKVREVLGNSEDISNEVIEDTLWYYYFDVSQTVEYLIEKYKCVPKSNNSLQQVNSSRTINTHLNSTDCPSTTKEKDLSQGTPLVNTQKSSPANLNFSNTMDMSKLAEASSKLSLSDITFRLSLQPSLLSTSMKKPMTGSLLGNNKPLLPLGSSTLSKSNAKSGFSTNLSTTTNQSSTTLKLPDADSKVKSLAPLTSTLSKNKAGGLTSFKNSSRISLSDLSEKSNQDDSKDHTHRSIITSALNALSQLPSSRNESSKKSSSTLNLSKATPMKPQSPLHLNNLSSNPKGTPKPQNKPPNTPKLQSRSPPQASPSEFSPTTITPIGVSSYKANLVASPSAFAISVFEKLDQELDEISYSNKRDQKFFYSMQSDHLPKSVTPFKFDSPSPDDIVLAAQSHRSGGKLEVK